MNCIFKYSPVDFGTINNFQYDPPSTNCHAKVKSEIFEYNEANKTNTIGGKLQAFSSAHVGFVLGINVSINVSAAGPSDGNWLPDQHPTQRHNINLKKREYITLWSSHRHVIPVPVDLSCCPSQLWWIRPVTPLCFGSKAPSAQMLLISPEGGSPSGHYETGQPQRVKCCLHCWKRMQLWLHCDLWDLWKDRWNFAALVTAWASAREPAMQQKMRSWTLMTLLMVLDDTYSLKRKMKKV